MRLAAACAGAVAAFVVKHRELFTGERLIPVSESYTGETGLTVRLTAPHESFVASACGSGPGELAALGAPASA